LQKKKPILSPEEQEMEKFKSLENMDESLNKDIDDDLERDDRHWVERLARIKPDFSKIQDQVLPQAQIRPKSPFKEIEDDRFPKSRIPQYCDEV
jgi:hypothetical protein